MDSGGSRGVLGIGTLFLEINAFEWKHIVGNPSLCPGLGTHLFEMDGSATAPHAVGQDGLIFNNLSIKCYHFLLMLL